jgi:hypothetical protein
MHGRQLAKGSRRSRSIALSLLGSVLLSGCAGSPFDNRPDYGRVNLAEGVTRVCYQDPCAVTLTLPPGDGPFTVRANGMVVGSYPAGQAADLGTFMRQDSPVSITVDGVERSTAVLYLLEMHQY